MDWLTIAIPKGRLLPPSIEILKAVGITCDGISDDSRRLVFPDEANKVRLLLMRSSDVPTYVEYGVADIGIVGKDVILEAGRDVCELLNLKFGFCRFVLAAAKDVAHNVLPAKTSGLRIATKFPRVAEEYFRRKGMRAEIIKLNGSVELAAITGLADAVVDIVSSGRTLAENDLVVVDDIIAATARLIANRASFRLKSGRIGDIMSAMQGVLESV